MRSLRSHIAFSVLVLAAGLGLTACSKQDKTALLVDVTLDKLVTSQPDKITFVVSRGSSTFATQHVDLPAASAGPLEVALHLPSEAAGNVSVDVRASLKGSPIAAATPSPTTTIVADKVNGPLAVTLTPFGGSGDGGVDALPSDGPGPDLAGGPEAGSPDASVTPDARSDGPGSDAVVPDAPAPADVVQPTDGARLPDVLQPADAADVGVDAAETTAPDAPAVSDVAPDVARLTDAVEAGGDTSVASTWQPVENIQYDSNDPLGSSAGYPGEIAVAVDPVKQHVYVMWTDYGFWAVRVRRWNHTTATWEPTRTLEDNGSGDPTGPQIGVDGAGHVIAAWRHTFISTTTESTINEMGGVWVSQSTDGVSWSAAKSVTPDRPRNVVELSMAVARNGQARMAFSERPTVSPQTIQLYSAYFDGTTWTTGPDPLAPEVSGDTNYRDPSVAIADDGSGIVLFTQNDSAGHSSVAASTFASATVNGFVILDSNTTDDLSEMVVAMNRSGQGVVVWGDSDGAMLRSYSPSTKTWTAAENIGKVGLYQSRVVMAQDGTVTVAWSEWVNGFYNVWTLEGTVGGTWTTPMALETDNLSIPNNQYSMDTVDRLPYPSLAVDGAGNVLALWSKKTKDTPTHEFAVEARRKLAGKPNDWQATTELAKKSVLMPGGLSLAVSDAGLGAAGYYWGDPDDTNDPDSHQVFVSLLR